jgi:hypothetical protein
MDRKTEHGASSLDDRNRPRNRRFGMYNLLATTNSNLRRRSYCIHIRNHRCRGANMSLHQPWRLHPGKTDCKSSRLK